MLQRSSTHGLGLRWYPLSLFVLSDRLQDGPQVLCVVGRAEVCYMAKAYS